MQKRIPNENINDAILRTKLLTLVEGFTGGTMPTQGVTEENSADILLELQNGLTDLGLAFDSVRVGDGTNSLVVNPDGSINTTPAQSDPLQVTLAKNDLGYDAWGRPKVILDHTLFSALWSYSVPNRMWLQWNDIGVGYVEQSEIDNVFVKSEGGHLTVSSTNIKDVFLISRRHPRYQPNKGLLYSTAVILPNPTYQGERGFGLYSTFNGLFFELRGNDINWSLWVVRRTTNGVTTDHETDITSFLPEGFDISKGHVYDIQAEWRGIGDIFVYVDLKLVYTMPLLGTLSDLSISNPALHVGYGCKNAGVNPIEILAGCVDVTSEGGHKSNKMYTSQSTGTTLLPTSNTGVAMLAIKIPNDIMYDGNTVPYTRDMILTEFTSFCKDEAFRSVMFGRLITTINLDALGGWNTATDSKYQWIDNSDGTLNTAYQLDKVNMQNIYTTRTEKDYSISHTNPDADHADFYFTAGDILLVEIKSDGVSTGGCTLEFAEEL